ncbi:MAG: IclR family transcriptional regulator [Actinomycetota bacterium]
MTETVQSIERAVALLAGIAERPDGLSGLARRTAMPTSTAGRLLATLERADTVVRDDDGTYRIGPAIVAMANASDAALPAVEPAARPHLDALADATGEAAGLSVPVGDQLQCVAQVDAPKPVRAEDWTGRRWPLHQGGAGLVVLAGAGPDAVAGYLDRHPDLDAGEFRTRLEEAGRSGVSWSHGDYREGLSSVAAPVRDHRQRAVASLYLYGPSYRFPGAQATELAELVARHAAALSTTIGRSATAS